MENDSLIENTIMVDVGRLIDIPPREAWQHEAHDFTPWLSDNLEQLGEAIGLELEPEGTEVAVGSFFADILARDVRGRVVLIENQLEATDHGHLGQILTYLSGLGAEIVVWVATDFREPHLSAINWLNEHTPDEFAFFAIKLRVVRINDSVAAPIFDVLARPNQWERSLQKTARKKTGEASEIASIRREFWKLYLERHPEDAALGVQVTGNPSNWLATPKGVGLFVSIYRAKTGVGVFLRGPRGSTPEEVQARLAPHVQQFEQLVGSCQHLGDISNHPVDEMSIDMQAKENWVAAIDWLHERAHVFIEAVSVILGKK